MNERDSETCRCGNKKSIGSKGCQECLAKGNRKQLARNRQLKKLEKK